MFSLTYWVSQIWMVTPWLPLVSKTEHDKMWA